MIGTKGTLKYIRTQIHNVPIVFCPVCHNVRVHYMIESEYEILAEYAHGDGAVEVDFLDYVDGKDNEALYENCVNHEGEEPMAVVKSQTDMALDLLSVAKQLNDEEWKDQLIKRLTTLSSRRRKLEKKKTARK